MIGTPKNPYWYIDIIGTSFLIKKHIVGRGDNFQTLVAEIWARERSCPIRRHPRYNAPGDVGIVTFTPKDDESNLLYEKSFTVYEDGEGVDCKVNSLLSEIPSNGEMFIWGKMMR